MIIPESDRSDSKAPTVRSGDSQVSPADAPPSPPPYSATAASSDDPYQTPDHATNSPPRSFSIPSGSMPNANSTPSPSSNLPPRCNHIVERKTNNSVRGTWHIDTALVIPEGLLPPVSEFDGSWNQDAQKARKVREKEQKNRDESNRRSGGTLPPLPAVEEVRPNLMLTSTNGAIHGNIHVVSSDGVMRQSLVVVQGTNGTINLILNASPEQPLRVHATSTNGSVNVKIPASFEGAVTMSTTWGSVKISDAIKAKLTTFSSTPNTSRCFIGDWQASGFGTTPTSTPNPDPSSPNDDPQLPVIQTTSGPQDPFASWPGSLVHLGTTNGSVSLSFVGEDITPAVASGFSSMVRGFMSGLFGGGGGGGGNDSGDGSGGQSPNRHRAQPSGSSAQRNETWPRDSKSLDGRAEGNVGDPA